MNDPEQALRSGASQLGLPLGDLQIKQLLDYLKLIAKWTRVYNLTAVRDPLVMVTHHLLDSLAVVRPLNQQLHIGSLLDVGSGAGLPGVIIAICCPTLAVSCVDTVAKKATFIKQVSLELQLPNLSALHARVENIDQPHDVICSRAFASLTDFTQWSAGALAPGGIWMAMKGKHPAEEIGNLPATVDMFHVEQLQVPELNADRCVVWMRQKSVS